MNEITVGKAKLMATLQANREAHAAIFRRAIERYRVLAIATFEDYVAQVKAGKPVPRVLQLPIPEEHTEDYDRAILMLEWETYDEVQLTMVEFAQYVQDKWGWHAAFTANSTSYTQ